MNSRLSNLLLGALAMGANLSSVSKRSEKTIDFAPKEPPIPKGTKRYSYEYKDHIFNCVAINEKNAKRKFSNWITGQQFGPL